MGFGLSALTLGAQETRKVLNNPTPTYPETARQFRLSGVVKVEVVIAPNGQIKDVKVIGGHPLLVNAVEETLKNWKYAPASSETTATLSSIFIRKMAVWPLVEESGRRRGSLSELSRLIEGSPEFEPDRRSAKLAKAKTQPLFS